MRHAGEDVRVGDVVAEPGTVLTPGSPRGPGQPGHRMRSDSSPAPCRHPFDRVTSCVVGPGPLAPGQIRDANRHTLLGLVRREGWDAVDLGIVGDDEGALATHWIERRVDCDAIVTSGGVSVGDLDIVKAGPREAQRGDHAVDAGGHPAGQTVRLRYPRGIGRRRYSALPGNPVSAMVSFELFVRPGVRRIAGHVRCTGSS